MERKGLIHIYCGDGKGKTTAAVGLAIRCAGGGGNVLFYQFLKNGKSSEIAALKRINEIELIDGYEGIKFSFNMTDDEKKIAADYYTLKFKEIVNKVNEKNYDMLILDEAVNAINLGYISIDSILAFLINKPFGLEVIMTGRNPDKKLMALADYISEIVKIKHPFDIGIEARKLIEM